MSQGQARSGTAWHMAAMSVLCAGWFVAFGILLVPLLGLQADEVMFLKNLYIPKGGVAWFSFFHHYYPAMMMSYLGALKSWLYAPVLLMGPLSVWEVRLPMLLVAALTIVALGRMLQMIVEPFAACLGMLLLATDGSLLLTAVNDWGPVVLQNFLMVAALWVLLRWNQSKRDGMLALAGFLLGLNLWNKALFLWPLSGLLTAFALVGHRYIARVWTLRRTAVLLLGLLLGAYPLIRYNLRNHAATAGQNMHFEVTEFPAKLRMMALTLNGQAAPGALVDLRTAAPDRQHRPLETLSRLLAARSLDVSTYLFYGGIAVLISGMAAGTNFERSWIVFFALADVLAWAEAALTAGAGGALHHTALFLILWYAAIAVACGAIARYSWAPAKPVITIVVALLCLRAAGAQNLVYAKLLNYEPRPAWSNAEAPFNRDLVHSGVQRALVLDWGFSDVITTRSRNSIAVTDLTGDLRGARFERGVYLACQAPACILVRHAPNAVIDAVSDNAFQMGLARERLVPVDVRVYRSTHGVPVIQTFHVQPK